MSCRTHLLTVLLCLSTSSGFAQQPQTSHAPFPENRLRDFYFRQAEQLLNSGQPIPDLLPQFPGLDGGAFGHWGQNPSEASNDYTLNNVDSGNIICSRIRHFGKNTQKGVAVRLSDGDAAISVVFDPTRLTFVDSWKGGFVSRGAGRFGVHDGAAAVGSQLVNFDVSRWDMPTEIFSRYLGFYRHGQHVVFTYQIGAATIYDRMWVQGGVLIRSMQIDGTLPTSAKLIVSKSPAAQDNQPSARLLGSFDPATTRLLEDDNLQTLKFADTATADATLHVAFGNTSAEFERSLAEDKQHVPKTMTTGGPGQWSQQTVTTTGTLGDDNNAFAIDTLTIPFCELNPFGTPMRLAGVGSLPDGRIAVSTLLGDVWMVSGVDSGLQQLTWQRIAAGLYQPLGLVIKDSKVVLGGNDQVTCLHDLNGDGEADFYECLTNEYPTTGGHDFATSLQQDNEGRLYWAVASGDFGVAQLATGTRPESLGNGLRNSNGIGVSADGSIVLATVQEGTWTPATAIFNVRNGSFHGHQGPRQGHGEFGYDLPQCFVPRGIDNSAGEICFLPDDNRLGPLSGKMIGSSYGYCNHYLLLREEVGDVVQGGVVPLPGEFSSGACRLHFNTNDGCIYVAGTEGWQSYGRENGCLQRLRYTGKSLHLPTKIETRSNGLIVHCNTKIDPASVMTQNVFCQQWNYLFSGAYGSPEYSVKQEGRQGHDYVPVRSVHLLPNGQSVFLEIPQLHPVMQFHVHLKLKSAEGVAFTPDAYSSIYEMGPAFTEFPDYQLIAKRRWPEFPKAEKYEQDPRLVEQDGFGTNFGWVSQATRLTLSAVTGLQYEPRRIRIAPGTRVALTFHNTDPGMPHNVVVVKADQIESFGEQAMMLASNPRAIATHYVPDDPAEICFSPILNPGDQYTVYFEAPTEPGKYRFLCTYPGHSKVMRGSLYVLPDDQPMPEPTEDEISRKFVKRWSLTDFAADVDQLAGRSVSRGETVFTLAGCVKCHKVGDQGTSLGPDLTDVHKRFKGSQLLRQILEPSAEIHKQYQTWLAVSEDGTVKSGLAIQQDDATITLLPNPLRPTESIVLQKANLDELIASKQSTMPEGLLMTFSKDEILDLLTFLQQAR